MRSRRRSFAYVVGVLTLTASGAAASVAATAGGVEDRYAEETAARLAREPATVRASSVLDAADLAAQGGDTAAARRRLDAASAQRTLNPAVVYRVARLAERLHDPGTAARAYRRYLSLAPNTPEAESARARLLMLVAGPLQPTPADLRLTQVASAGEIERASSVKATPSPKIAKARSAGAARSGKAAKHKAARRHHAKRR